jgi:hypothetical protein
MTSKITNENEWIMKKIGPISLDGVTADRITLLNLKEWRSFLKKELKEWKKNPHSDSNPNGYWIHPEDLTINLRTIEAINYLVKQME